MVIDNNIYPLAISPKAEVEDASIVFNETLALGHNLDGFSEFIKIIR